MKISLEEAIIEKEPSSAVVTPVMGWLVDLSTTKTVAKGIGCSED
jgi:hypothetical protein